MSTKNDPRILRLLVRRAAMTDAHWAESLRERTAAWEAEDRDASTAWERQVELERERLEQRRREEIEKAMRERTSATIH